MGRSHYRPRKSTFDPPPPRDVKHHPDGPLWPSRSETVLLDEPHPRHDPRPEIFLAGPDDEE
jgi:hypothetical protein